MKDNPSPAGTAFRSLAAAVTLAFLAAGGIAAAQPPAGPAPAEEHRRDHSGAVPKAPPDGDAGHEEARDRTGFVLGLEAGGGLLWNDRPLGRSAEGMAGLTVGYDLGSLRLEAEFLGRAIEEGEAESAGFAPGFWGRRGGFGGLGGLFGGIGGLEAETGQFFLNFHYDFESGSRLTPFVGVGGGWAHTTVEYEVVPPWFFPPGDHFVPFAGPMESEASDSVPGVQLLAGAEMDLAAGLSLGVKLRWSRFGRARFEGSDGGLGGVLLGLGTLVGTFAEEPGAPEPGRGRRGNLPVDGLLDLFLGDLVGGLAPPLSLDLGGVAATLQLTYRF